MDSKTKTVVFEYCGRIDDDSKDIAFDIAYSSCSELEAWHKVGELMCDINTCRGCKGCATANAICEVGSFIELIQQ